MSNHKHSKSQGIPMWVHLTLLLLIVLIVGGSALKLLKWNKGIKISDEPNDEDYSVEVLDQIFLLPDDKKQGHVDDGKETILMIGNDALSYYQGDTSFQAKVASKTGATVIAAGFPETTIARRLPLGDDSYQKDAFSFYNIAQTIVDESYEDLFPKTQEFTDSTYYNSLLALKELDMSSVDTLVIMYDPLDYVKGRTGRNPENDLDPQTYMGSLKAGIQAIQQKYPYIRIVCMSLTFCYTYDDNGNIANGDRKDFGNGKLTTYFQHMMDVCGDTGVSFVDNYYGTADVENSSDMLLDNIHVSEKANERMAQHFVDAIYPNGVGIAASNE